MGRLMVITTPDLESGFQLAGVETFTAAGVEEAEAILGQLMAGQEASLILVRRSLLQAMNPRLQHRIAGGYRPLVMAIPSGAPARARRGHGRYITELIRQAIGFRISFGHLDGEAE